ATGEYIWRFQMTKGRRMKGPIRCAVVASILVITGCTGGTLRLRQVSVPPVGGSGIRHAAQTPPDYRVLYRFKGTHDGAQPAAALLDVDGTLYGTTAAGGNAGGTVYSVTPKGNERVLHVFSGNGDGWQPSGPLTDINGTLYGVTYYGGSSLGAVYSISTSGNESVLHAFAGGPDGAHPTGSLVAVNGVLYGTSAGGGPGCGTFGCG